MVSGKGKRRRGKGYDFAAFRGYRGPRFTPIPDEFLDQQLADLSSAEAKVMLFLFRKTYGYRKSADRVSFAQLERGTMSADGMIIDRGTGLSKATIWRALKGLQEKGLIEVHRQTTPAGDADINYYRIREYDERASGEDHKGPAVGPGGPSDVPSPGLSHSETTPVSKLNDPRFTTKRPGGFRTKTTRENSPREDSTLPRAIEEAAIDFLRAIGYPQPAKAKRERTIRVLNTLALSEGYSLDDLRAACSIAADLGARGPELIPHVIGQAPRAEPVSAPRLAASEAKDTGRWNELRQRYDALSEEEQTRLQQRAQALNPLLAERPSDHPLIRAAAIAFLDQEETDGE